MATVAIYASTITPREDPNLSGFLSVEKNQNQHEKNHCKATYHESFTDKGLTVTWRTQDIFGLPITQRVPKSSRALSIVESSYNS